MWSERGAIERESELGVRSNRVLVLSVGIPLPKEQHRLNIEWLYDSASGDQREVNQCKQWQLDFHHA